MTEGKGRVLVVMNRFQNYEHRIPEALCKIGYEAAWSDARPGNSFLMKVLIRLGLLQFFTALSLRNARRVINDAQALGADTVLLISPENFRAREIAFLREARPGVRVVLYMFDSSANRPLDQTMIDSADRAYSFDIDDCDSYQNLRHVPLFHPHDTYRDPSADREDYSYDYSFIGTARARRIEVLADIERGAARTGARCFFYLFAPSAVQYIIFRLHALRCGYKGTLSRKSIPFEFYVETLARSSCVIDIEQQGQCGLTIRTMDAVFAGRPLATTNENIKRQDFFPHFPVSVFRPGADRVEVPTPRSGAETEAFFWKYHIHSWLETILTDRPVHYRLDTPEATAGPATGLKFRSTPGPVVRL